MSLLPDIAAATAAGVVTTVVGHPLDTIKVHLQTNRSMKSTKDAARSLLNERALLRGIVPPLCNAIIMNTAMFSVFHSIKEMANNNGGDGDNGDNDNRMTSALLAGTLSGFATACISTPTDYIKIQSQLSKTKGGGTSSWKIFRSTPMRVLYRGHVANLGREGLFTMVYLGFYDQLQPRGFWQIAAASSCTGGLAWVASYPLDTLKTIVQSSSSSSSTSINGGGQAVVGYREAMSRLGTFSAYYRGCGASTWRAIMVTSLRMIVYEGVLGNLQC
jgi:solute carrier family 25 carnitine/acylcarnitine transporter 20/29